jgi:FSR family fosmidomycin resistance protein-like MFS transporter
MIKTDLDLSNVQVGSLAAAKELGFGTLMLPSGFVADLFVRRRPLILAFALACFGLAYFLVGLAPGYIWVLLALLLVGLASAAWHPASVSSLSSRFSERRGTALAIHGVGASVGDTISPLCVGALLLLVSWRHLLEFHLLPALVLALLLWRSLGSFYAEEGPGPSLRSYLGGIIDLVRQPSVVAIMLAGSLMSMGRLSVLTFLPIYLTEDLGYSSFALGFYVMLLYLMGMVSQPVMGVISDRFGRMSVLLPSFTALGLLYFVLPTAGAGVQLALVVAAIGLFFYSTSNIILAAVMDVSVAQVHGSAMSVMSVVRQVFVLPSPIIAGFIVTEYGTEASFYYSSALLLMAVLVLLGVRSLRRPAASGG